MVSSNPLFPIGFDVYGRPVLVIGGGQEAENKTERLLDSGAMIHLVTLESRPALQAMAARADLVISRRLPRRSDLRGVVLVLNTLDKSHHRHNQRIWRWAIRRHIPVNTYDQPHLSTFGMPALVSRGHLRLAISTSNASPALSRRLRQNLELIFTDEFGQFLARIGDIRGRAKEVIVDPAARVALLRGLVDGVRLVGELQLPPDWRSRLQAADSELGDNDDG